MSKIRISFSINGIIFIQYVLKKEKKTNLKRTVKKKENESISVAVIITSHLVAIRCIMIEE